MMSWWGDLAVDEGQTMHLALGPLDLWATRAARAWTIHRRAGPDRPIAATHAAAPPRDLAPERTVRVPASATPLALTPAMPDRPVVARPSAPITIPGGVTIELFLATPLWIQLADGTTHRFLYETCSVRLQDTWLGRTTMAGELCYAHRPPFAATPDEVEPHPARAITKVSLTNAGNTPLVVDRVLVPGPNLALFADERGAFWTQPVSVAGDKRGLADFDISGHVAPETRGARSVAPAREPAGSAVARAYDAMFG